MWQIAPERTDCKALLDIILINTRWMIFYIRFMLAYLPSSAET